MVYYRYLWNTCIIVSIRETKIFVKTLQTQTYESALGKQKNKDTKIWAGNIWFKNLLTKEYVFTAKQPADVIYPVYYMTN